MTAPPQVITRSLTFKFAKSVSTTTGLPDLMEVAVLPLLDASVAGQATYTGGLKTATVELSDAVNSVSFDLIPTFSPGLTAPVDYRVMWRAGVQGRTSTYDFVMPDQDLDWDALVGGLGEIIGGEVYLQQSDLGVPGRVARLDDQGRVINAYGVPAISTDDLAAVINDLQVEVVARAQGDAAIQQALEIELFNQTEANLVAAKAYTDTKDATLAAALAAEISLRHTGDVTLAADLSSTATDLQTQIDSLTAEDVGAIPLGGEIAMESVVGLIPALDAKATTDTTSDLQNQVSALANDATVVHTVASLVPNVVMPANIALVNVSGNITNKSGTVVALGTGAAVTSVNTKVGAVTINLNDMSAAGGSVTQAQVGGLTVALSGKAATTDTRFTDSRTPTTHATTHAAAGSDPVTVTTTQVTGLSGILSNNGLTASSNHESRLATLEIAGPGGGGEGSPAKSLWFDGTTDFTETVPGDFQALDNVLLKGPWAKDDDDNYFYHADGVAGAGESYVYPYITPNGHLELRVWDEQGAADAVYATTAAVALKADQSSLNTTNAAVALKATQADMSTAQGAITTINATLPTKADLSGGKLVAGQVPTNIPQASVTSLVSTLALKADLDGSSKVLVAQIPTGIPQASISGLVAALLAKADLSGGVLTTGQLPQQAFNNVIAVANRAALLAQTYPTAHLGTIGQITAGADLGTYVLKTDDPSQFTNWALISAASAGGTVTSVNGNFGPTVVLTATDVGAAPSNATWPIASVTGLQPALDLKATITSLNTGLASKASPGDVQTMLYTSGLVKRADYVATSAIASLAGQQSADGVLMPLGSIVLATAQSSSVNNGLWTVNAGAWTRPANFATGSYLVRDTIIIVRNTTAGADGATNPNTIWQMTVASGFIDTNLSTWTRIGWTSPPLAAVEGNGITISGTYPAKTFAAKTVSGGGVLSGASGLSVDTNLFPKKATGTVPSGNVLAAITHNLNSNAPTVSIYEAASGNLVLAGVTVTSVNAISIEFANAPASGQYRYAILA